MFATALKINLTGLVIFALRLTYVSFKFGQPDDDNAHDALDNWTRSRKTTMSFYTGRLIG